MKTILLLFAAAIIAGFSQDKTIGFTGTTSTTSTIIISPSAGTCTLDPKQGFREVACIDGSGKVTIKNGYTAEQVYRLMYEREGNAWSQLSASIDTRSRAAMAVESARNAKSEFGKSPRIVEIASVFVSKTSDTGDPTIMITTISGKQYTLWLHKDGSVRAVSDY